MHRAATACHSRGSGNRDEFATKTDLAVLRADMYRALWIQGAGIVGAQIAIAGFVVHLLSQ